MILCRLLPLLLKHLHNSLMMVQTGTKTCSKPTVNIQLCYNENSNAYLLKLSINHHKNIAAGAHVLK